MDKFYFVLTEKVEGTSFRDLADIYEAELVNGEYIVHWHEYGEHFCTDYPVRTVNECLEQGYWIKLSESEVKDFIKGLY